jgi:hypothetical protein
MLVGVCGGDAKNPAHLQLVDKELDKLIEDSGVYLFTMFSARIKGSEHTEPPLAQQYAQLRGIPCKRKEYHTFDTLVKGICYEVDYLIILNDKTQPIKRLFMSYKQTGKHGSMIEL